MNVILRRTMATITVLALVFTLCGCDGHGGKSEQKAYEQRLLAVLKERYDEDFNVTKLEYNWNRKQYDFEVKSKVAPYAVAYGKVSVEAPLKQAVFYEDYIDGYIQTEMQQYFYSKLVVLFPRDAYYYVGGSINNPEYYQKIAENFKHHKPKYSEILADTPETLFQTEFIHVYLDLDTVDREEVLKKVYSYVQAHKAVGLKTVEFSFQFIDNSTKELWNPAERYVHPEKLMSDFQNVRGDLVIQKAYFITIAIGTSYERIETYEKFREDYKYFIDTKWRPEGTQ